MATPHVTESEILDRFAQVVARSLRIDAALVKPDAYLCDLGAESLDLIEMTMEAEEEFNIIIPQKDILQTAQEILGYGVLVRDGNLTDEGARFLHRRMPEADRAAVVAGMSLADLGRAFQRVDTWVRMIEGLIAASPQVCPKCEEPFPKAVAGRLKCAKCAAEVDLPSGDDLNRRWVEEYQRTALPRATS